MMNFRGMMMGLAVAAGAVLPGSAALADHASPWKGFYIGVHGGWDEVSWTNPLATITPTIRERGAVFGGHAGYNWQSDSFVFGVEADLSSSSAKHTFGGGTATATLDNPYLTSLRARAGVTVAPALLLYATGGLAATDVNLKVIVPGFSATAVGSSTGWVAGGGLEYKMSGAPLSVRGEILHYSFSKVDMQFAGVSVLNIDNSATVVRAGLTYHFH